MLIDLTDVMSDQHKPVDVAVVPDMEEIRIRSGVYPIVRKGPAHVRVEHIRGNEFLITADSEAEVVIPCDRCLRDVRRTFLLSSKKHVDVGVSDAELTEDLDESVFIEGRNLDVDRMLYNEFLSNWPEKVLCKEDCKGLCSVCGQDLNAGACGCEDTGLDPRMSVVRDLFKNFKEV